MFFSAMYRKSTTNYDLAPLYREVVFHLPKLRSQTTTTLMYRLSRNLATSVYRASSLTFRRHRD